MRIFVAVSHSIELQSPPRAVPDLAPVLDALTTALQDRYIDVDVAERMTRAIRQEQADGVYARLTSRTEVAQALTSRMQAISRDKHLRVLDGPPPQGALSAKPTVGRVEVLPGNIGYLEVPSLVESPETAAPAIAEAMKKVVDTAALIIDVRGNSGGQPGTVALLAAYLLKPESVLLGTIVNRSRGSRLENRTPATVDGPRYGTTRPVFVLINRRSASGAESFAYHLQAFGRVTVVGEQSAGAANPGGFVRLPNEFTAFIPTGRVTNPVTGTNWEGTGVTPNILTDDAGALDAARKAAAGGRNMPLLPVLAAAAARSREGRAATALAATFHMVSLLPRCTPSI